MNRHFQPFPPLPPCPQSPPCQPPTPCAPENCRCDRCCPPEGGAKPFPPGSFLLPRILAAGRIWLRRTPFCLCLTGVDPCAEPPFTLLSVEPSCAQPRWETVSSPSPHQLCLHVWIPLTCRLRDGCGNCLTAEAEAEVDVPLRLSMPRHECWRASLVVLPCVRLVCAPPPSDDLCLNAQLEIIVEAYLTRWESCLAGMPKPVSANGC